MRADRTRPTEYPGGARFAFSIVDDTDNATIGKLRPVYDLLTSLGLRVTKTVWVYPPRDQFQGLSLSDPAYLAFIRELGGRGHEIALHNVGSGRFTREEIVRGLEIFREQLGHWPALHANHVSNPDNLYWRPERRFRPPISWAYAAIRQFMRAALGRPLTTSAGEIEGAPEFWGDLARRHIRYVRNLTFSGLNTLRADPLMPYHDRRKPFVNQWFSASDGHTVEHFNDLLTDTRITSLEQEGGAAIVYTHFTDGFVRDGVVDPTFELRIRRLAARPGWFVPASQILDFLAAGRAAEEVSDGYLRALEYRWLAQRAFNYVRYLR
jgi:hypothetical protein